MKNVKANNFVERESAITRSYSKIKWNVCPVLEKFIFSQLEILGGMVGNAGPLDNHVLLSGCHSSIFGCLGKCSKILMNH